MIEGRGGAGFLFDPAKAVGVGRKRGAQNLDGDVAPEAWISRLVDLSHAPSTNGSKDLVRAETGANGKGQARLRITRRDSL
jgi:hypothetical protein